MTISRRGFLGSILAACAAPAIVRADSLMRIIPRDLTLLLSPAERLVMNPLAWAGAIREWSAWDIRTDEKITRFDVMVRTPAGDLNQLGVDIRESGLSPPRPSDRGMVLDLLKRKAAEEGVPVVGKLALPGGAEYARFL